ncbi:MAG: hypothetical protein WDN49_20680 [Acetobacteraceae bacterium]
MLLDGFVTDGFAAESSRALYEVLPDIPAVLRRLADLPAGIPTDATRL